jgi:5-oxoprolinase (ATP-hydrolysing) subunit A
MRTIDVNADLGESYGSWRMGDDVAMLDLVTSANIACGFHAGDPKTIRSTVAAAAERGVVIGAHVAYPDLVGFGRRTMEVAPDELEADVLYQLGALEGICRVHGARVRYVKPHGALYHRVNSDPKQASALANAVALFDPSLPLLGAAGPLVAAAAEHGLTTVGEGFPDRAYRPDGTLVPRSEPGAVITDPAAVATHAVDLTHHQGIRSLCLHGDTPNAVHHARAVTERLRSEGFDIAAFV